MRTSIRAAAFAVAFASVCGTCPAARAVTSVTAPPRGLLPTLIADAAGDQGAGPDYADILGAGMVNSGGDLLVAERVRGEIPASPPPGFAGYSWRFDTDLNSNTGYRQYDYIGIDWEIRVQPDAGGWQVAKWSPDGGVVPLPAAVLFIQHSPGGDYVGVRFDPAEIGRPPHVNWIAWNGLPPEWEDVAPDATVAWWEH